MIAERYNSNKLKRYIEKVYWENGQKLLLEPMEVMPCDNVDIFLGKKYLFEIINYRCLLDDSGWWYSFYINKTLPFKPYETMSFSLLDEATYRPFYFDRTFFLRKETPITKEDICYCARYFTEKILGSWSIFNIKIKEGN